ncbi:MAG: hypothetical protein ACP5DX_04470 [Paracoccaceae bacterium]
MIMMDLISVLFGMSRPPEWQIDAGYSYARSACKGLPDAGAGKSAGKMGGMRATVGYRLVTPGQSAYAAQR